MTIDEAREYWSRRLERASGYSDEHWDAEERHAHADYIDALKHAVTALAICREREEAAKKPKTNADRIRNMTDEELAEMVSMKVCRIVKPDGSDCPKGFYFGKCDKCVLKWLKQEVSEDAGTD